MTEIDLLNRLLIYFNEQQHSNMLLVQNLDVAFRGMADGLMPNVNVERLCEQLYKDEFIYREVSYPNSGLQVNRYSISTKGIVFFSELPFGNKEEPYSYYLFQQNEKSKKQDEKEKLERDSIQANIDVSKSVEDTNTKTATFYTKQTGYNSWQKWLTIAIFAATAVQAGVATCNYVAPISSDKGIHIDTATHNQQLRTIESRIQSQTNKFDTFEKAVKDSLKMK